MKKRIISFILAAAVVLSCFGVAACKGSAAANANIFVPFNQVQRFDVNEIQLLPGISADKVIWLSENSDVLSVDSGVIQAKSIGRTTITAKYFDLVQKQAVSVVKSESDPQIKLNDIPLLKGQSVTVTPKLVCSGEIIDYANFVLSVENSAIATIDQNVVTAVEYGSTNVVVKAFIENEEIASKTVVCSVKENSGIIPALSVYDLYSKGNIKGVNFATELDLGGQVVVDGQTVENAHIEWTVENSSIATIVQGKLKAVSLGDTYLSGTYTADGVTLKTTRLPVRVSVPILDSINGVRPDVIIDLDKQFQSFNATEILGDGNLGYIESDDGRIKKTVTDNALPTGGFTSGEYACIAYNSDKTFGVKINLHIADFVVYDYATLLEVCNPENVSGYTVLANDVDCGSKGYVNNYLDAAGTTFTGVLNGLGHVISEFGSPDGTGIYKDSNSGTFKNLAVTGLRLDSYNNGALFYRNVQGNETLVDNVYVEASCAGKNMYSGGLCAFNFKGSVKVTNTIVKVTGTYTPNVGAFIGRSNEMISITNSYTIGEFLVASEVPNAYNKQFDNINRQTNVKFDSAEAYVKARYKDDSKINLNGFNQYWDLSRDVPCFKSVAN